MKSRRFRFPIIDPREHAILTARLHSDGIPVVNPATGEETIVRTSRLQCRFKAGSTLVQNATKFGAVEATRLFDARRLSRTSFDKVLAAEKRAERFRRGLLRSELETESPSRRRREEIARELARPKDRAPLVRALTLGRNAFDAAQSARARAQRRAQSGAA